MIVTQTLGMLAMAYRELNAKKLFWVTMAFSLMVVGVFASLGVTDEGLAFLWLTFPIDGFNRELFPPDQFYAFLFTTFGIDIWLTWIATGLALVSTCSIIPDLVAEGSVETMLSRPIGRVRLFLTKYATGLLFVGLQVLVFSVGSVLVFGLRGGVWEPGVLLAVPIVLVFYSYLFSICALIGLLTRSSIAALLLTALSWFALFLMNTADAALLQAKNMQQFQSERLENMAQLERGAAEAKMRRERAGSGEDDAGAWKPTEEEVAAFSPSYVEAVDEFEDRRETVASLDAWHGRVVMAKAVLPKTSETIDLLGRYLIDRSALPFGPDETEDDLRPDERAQLATIEQIESRSPVTILATSLGFEAVVLGIACFVFWRKDY